jgi:hypothetical protein
MVGFEVELVAELRWYIFFGEGRNFAINFVQQNDALCRVGS